MDNNELTPAATTENQETGVENTENVTPVTDNQVIIVEEPEKTPPAPAVNKKASRGKPRFPYVANLSQEENDYVEPVVKDLIKFGIVDNPSHFVKTSIDFYINYQKVCEENNLQVGLKFPIPNGEQGSISFEHKLLKGSLFSKYGVSKLQTIQ